MFWDIYFAERYNTTPWDVRAGMTVYDKERQVIWDRKKGEADKARKHQQEQQARFNTLRKT